MDFLLAVADCFCYTLRPTILSKPGSMGNKLPMLLLAKIRMKDPRMEKCRLFITYLSSL